MEQSHLWYEYLNNQFHLLAQKHNLTVEKVVGIFVTFSAQKEFSENLTQTIQFLENKPITGMYSQRQLSTARRILSGECPKSLWAKRSHKFRNFYDSIFLRDGAVCVDTHIIRYYLKKYPYSKLHRIDMKVIFERQWAYQIIQNHVRKVASEMGLKSYQTQAHIWVSQRGSMW